MTPFLSGAAAGLRAAAEAVEARAEACRQIADDGKWAMPFRKRSRIEQEALRAAARAIRAIDPASVKQGETDADHG